MPFTPSHAVVALPFVRTPLVPAAIAVGAMTPDLPIFTRGYLLRYSATHDFAWLPATLLLALALLFVWRCVLRPAARELSPSWLAARLPSEWDRGAGRALAETLGGGVRGILLLVASLAIGVVSHIVWDLFTHHGRWGVRLLPALDTGWAGQPLYAWLQDASSALGLGILAVAGVLWLRRRPASPPVRRFPRLVRWTWWVSLPVALAAGAVWGYVVFGPFRPGFGIEHLAYLVLPPAAALWGVATLVLAVVVAPSRRR